MSTIPELKMNGYPQVLTVNYQDRVDLENKSGSVSRLAAPLPCPSLTDALTGIGNAICSLAKLILAELKKANNIMSLVEADKPSGDTATKLSGHMRGLKPWKPGQTGNPAGRPVAARQKLNENFVNQLSSDFAKHGSKAIVKMRETDPSSYVRVCASLLPKDVFVHQGPLAELTPDEIAALAYAARRAVAVVHDSGSEEQA
jgi:hypothetical protein